MVKKKKEKKNRKINIWWNTIKELWKHPRYRAMIKLGFYFIFIGGVLIFLQVINIMNRNRKEVVYKTPMEQFAEQTTYHYQMKLEELNPTLITQEVIGDKDSLTNKFMVTGDTQSYLIQDNIYYNTTGAERVIVNNPVLFDIKQFTPTMLKELIESGEEISNTTYKTGIQETTYEIPLKQFIKLYTKEESTIDGTITCKVQLKEQTIHQIEIDLTNYRKVQVPTLNSSKLIMQFSK